MQSCVHSDANMGKYIQNKLKQLSMNTLQPIYIIYTYFQCFCSAQWRLDKR